MGTISASYEVIITIARCMPLHLTFFAFNDLFAIFMLLVAHLYIDDIRGLFLQIPNVPTIQNKD